MVLKLSLPIYSAIFYIIPEPKDALLCSCWCIPFVVSLTGCKVLCTYYEKTCCPFKDMQITLNICLWMLKITHIYHFKEKS